MEITQRVEFFVLGVPKPGGSKRAFMVGKKGGPKRPIIVDMAKNEDWKTAVREAAAKQFKEPVLWPNISLDVTFWMPRPKYHFDKKGALRANAPFWHNKKPDRTKLLRALEDALTGIAWIDDASVVVGMVQKIYMISGWSGATVTIGNVV